MRSTAETLTLYFVLSVNLCTLVAHPVHPCNMQSLLKLEEHEIKQINLSLNYGHHPHDPAIIHPLIISKSLPIPQQNKTAVCGLKYMKDALEKIHNHHIKFGKKIQELNVAIIRLKEHVIPCAHHIFGKCDHPPEPAFPTFHFQAKQWTQSLLNSSVKFLHEILHLFEKSKHKKKNSD